ncbi:hypothetical protein B0O80DRAFT_446937 [Mortierella sp. GBAus27b]|nr:hypothetical protein B0O80DRAFT_446937 [Mortierella sp. GBAus27b]
MPLHLAIISNRIDVVAALLKAGNYDRNTCQPVHVATSRGREGSLSYPSKLLVTDLT